VSDRLKLTVYLGERGLGSDELLDLYQRHRLQTSILLRGTAGFGLKQHFRSDRQLTLSEDLPLVSVAIDTRERIEAALADVRGLGLDGRITVESASLPDAEVPGEPKLTLYLGRGQRIDGQPAYRVAVERLHASGAAGATVLLGVDGTEAGQRRRAGFFRPNPDVPLMVVSVGAREVPDLPVSLATLERVTVCKRDGVLLAEPEQRGEWQKLSVYVSEQAQLGGRPLYAELLRRLRQARAAGATSLRGIWGYHGDHQPHGDSFLQLRRRAPVVTLVVDQADRIHDWFAIVDELTSQTGLVTSEVVPLA
jgi:PII-like signaling protein